MENNPDMESFERFIKQQSDDFRMYPTKRVWYSLYNNLHPGRKWPSISMCIVLLTTLFLIGFLNTNNNHNSIATGRIIKNTDLAISSTSNPADKDKIISIQNTKLAIANAAFESSSTEQKVTGDKSLLKTANTKQLRSAVLLAASQQQKTPDLNTKAQSSFNSVTITQANDEKADIIQAVLVAVNEVKTVAPLVQASSPTPADEESAKTANAQSGANNAGSGVESLLNELQKLPATSIENNTLRTAETAKAGVSISEELLSKTALTESDLEGNRNIVTNLTDKSWIENYALYNKPAPKKWKGKMAWQAYFTPSVSYRKLFNNAAGKNIGTGFNGSTDVTLSKEVTQSASIGLEGGMGLQYPVFKGIKIKAGLQLNYTRYNITAFENAHPSITSLEMLSEVNGKPYELYKTTAYSNNAGLKPVSLHSQTFQLSIPVGADVKLAGNDFFEWYAGATIQPTLVFAASSYLISTDRRNYVKDNSMLNHFNMNAAFETYISFKSPGGLTWQVGPQLRKQLYSTSTKFYTVEERLMGYGLKIGFIKKL